MDNKTKKAQVVIAAIDAAHQSFQFLLLQTNEKRGAFWQNVTGKIEEGETFEEGALREAMEETNLELNRIVDILDLGLVYEFVDKRKRKVIEHCFLMIFEKTWDVKIDSSEHRAFKWVGIESINSESVEYPSNYETLNRSIKILKQWGHS